MFELSREEVEKVVSQSVIPSKSHFGGAVPFAFTGNGVAMLSSALNSRKAIDVNITIMRTFTLIGKALFQQKDIQVEIDVINRKQRKEHDWQIKRSTGL